MRHLFLPLILLALASSACSSGGSTNKDLNGSGSVVGNGMTAYVNPKMNVAFEYPKLWQLDETDDLTLVRLSNVTVANNGATSTLLFAMRDSYDGRKFSTPEELLAHLKSKYQNREWRNVSFKTGWSGFIWRIANSEQLYGEGIAINERGDILTVQFDASSNSKGIIYIAKIVDSLTTDVQSVEKQEQR